MLSLEGRVCVITGAARGIGRAVAEGFAKRGAVVVAADRGSPQVPGSQLSLAWDVAEPARAEEVVRQTVARFGRIDVMVANAGIYPFQPWDQIDPGSWRRVMAVNLDGAWYSAQAAASAMQQYGYGKIVLVSSVQVVLGADVAMHFAASKAAIVGLTRSLARAVGRKGIRVNAIMPGAVRTEGELEQAADEAASAEALADRQCLPSRIHPQDVEPAFAFLSAADSDAITGQVLCVDHGLVHY